MSELEWMKRVEEGESDGVRWVTASAWRVPRDHAGRDISLPPPRSSVNSLQGRRWWRGPMEERRRNSPSVCFLWAFLSDVGKRRRGPGPTILSICVDATKVLFSCPYKIVKIIFFHILNIKYRLIIKLIT